MGRWLPRYPVYIPSKSRFATPLTIRALQRDNVPFSVVVEPQEADEYARIVSRTDILVLPWSGDDSIRREFCAERGIENGGLIAVRNWIKEHSIQQGAARHWQLDDNIRRMMALYEKRRIQCDSGLALRVCEDFTDRYSNVAISGLNYSMFMYRMSGRAGPAPFRFNVHVYSCTLVNNALPYRWRLLYNDDTDMCLQVLAAGYCTLALNAFLAEKVQTMLVKGGNTSIYQGDGRRRMARALERIWPGVITTGRRFNRPQHVVAHQWRRFDTPLVLKENPPPIPDYGVVLAQVAAVKAGSLKTLLGCESVKCRHCGGTTVVPEFQANACMHWCDVCMKPTRHVQTPVSRSA